MATPVRKFGTIISGNRQRNHEFNSESRALMCNEIFRGRSYRDVASEFGTSPSTVHKIFKRWENDKMFISKARPGRPLKLTKSEIHYIILMLKKERHITYEALRGSMGGRVSLRTIQRIVRRYYGRKWKAMQRIPISKETAKIRLRWVQAWKDDMDELMEV